MANIYDMSDTWNAGATTFTAIKMNVTDTASNAASLLMDLQVGGATKASINKNGQGYYVGTNDFNPDIRFGPTASVGIGQYVNNSFFIRTGGETPLFAMSSGVDKRVQFSKDFFIGWQPVGGGATSAAATRLYQDADFVLAQRNSTNAQTFNIYNTYTDASNYERGFTRWSANTYELGVANAGTGSVRNMRVGVGANITYIANAAGSSLALFGGAFFPNANPVSLGRTADPINHLYMNGDFVSTPTWNNVATTFTGIGLNVTDTASASGSLLMDLQVGGTSKFKVNKNGYIALPSNDFIFYAADNSTRRMIYNTTGLAINKNQGFVWSSNNYPLDVGGAITAGIFVDAANTLAQRNSTNAQTFNLYNTYTDASNYERGFMKWNSNVLEIGAEAAGTGTARAVKVKSGGTVVVENHLSPSVNTWSLGATTPWNNLFLNNNVQMGGYQEITEMTAPAAPAANKVRIYAEDDGAGKTRLMALFPTGAAQQIAIEP